MSGESVSLPELLSRGRRVAADPYMISYQQRTYNVFGTANKDAAE